MEPQLPIQSPQEGIYYLRPVIIGRNMGLGGMYATRGEFGEPIQTAALVPSTFEHRDWRIVRAGNDTFRIENAQKYPSGVQLTGFHNIATDDGTPVLLDQPKEFTICPVGDGIPFGEDVYIIRPHQSEIQGMDICVGVEQRGVVIKAIPADAPLEARPGWYFSRRHDLEDAS
ncbi:unnamed protein product [Rhizoctonia solani]|uniref:Uncharacterized protein n=1 Tax=Rhizoctonia solani TaxID=456999 RepID=A0A8H3BU16_9AGAM|nr:unnamed protein product [Rhizoctonia solani]